MNLNLQQNCLLLGLVATLFAIKSGLRLRVFFLLIGVARLTFALSWSADMSWDLFAMKFPMEIHDLSELPDDFNEAPIGTRSEVSAAILELPNSRLSGHYINIETQTYAIEVSLGEESVCSHMMFYVHGNGSGAVEVIQRISERLSVRTWDINGAQFLD